MCKIAIYSSSNFPDYEYFYPLEAVGRGCLGGVGAGVVRLSHRTWEVTARSGI